VALYRPAVRRLVLERFRSIPSACINFDNPTIFVGRNGSGKSNLISAFSFLADAMSAPLRTVLDRAGGLSALRAAAIRRGSACEWTSAGRTTARIVHGTRSK